LAAPFVGFAFLASLFSFVNEYFCIFVEISFYLRKKYLQKGLGWCRLGGKGTAREWRSHEEQSV